MRYRFSPQITCISLENFHPVGRRCCVRIKIRFLEKSDIYYDKMLAFFQNVVNEGLQVCTSVITYEEYEVGPLKNRDEEQIRTFEQFIDEMNIEIINIDRFIASKAASLRALYPGFKGMDALQLSAAVASGCDLFLTNDKS